MSGINNHYTCVFNNQYVVHYSNNNNNNNNNQSTAIENVRSRTLPSGEIEEVIQSHTIVKYEGEMNGRMMHGIGKVFFSTGSVLDATFRDGYPLKGTLTHADGRIYEGPFLDGKKHGAGTLTYPNGIIFRGHFAKGKKEGIGITTYPDGKKEKVNYVNDKAVGDYEITYPKSSKEKLYKGQMLNGKKQGVGSLFYKDKTFYEGEFEQDVKQGQGQFNNGNTYWGSFKNGELTGDAYAIIGCKLFYGPFEDFLPHGWMYVRPFGAEPFRSFYDKGTPVGPRYYI